MLPAALNVTNVYLDITKNEIGLLGMVWMEEFNMRRTGGAIHFVPRTLECEFAFRWFQETRHMLASQFGRHDLTATIVPDSVAGNQDTMKWVVHGQEHSN